ncbi:cold shock domain-containing protein, partial [Erwinia amylovora]|uniref:cold shock domain-containing protein n=1 Tax=Erwinia amylovora TaxID=552 RepID=UPI00200A1D1A
MFIESKGIGFITPDDVIKELNVNYSQIQGHGYKNLDEIQKGELEIQYVQK